MSNPTTKPENPADMILSIPPTPGELQRWFEANTGDVFSRVAVVGSFRFEHVALCCVVSTRILAVAEGGVPMQFVVGQDRDAFRGRVVSVETLERVWPVRGGGKAADRGA